MLPAISPGMVLAALPFFLYAMIDSVRIWKEYRECRDTKS